jgi:amidase
MTRLSVVLASVALTTAASAQAVPRLAPLEVAEATISELQTALTRRAVTSAQLVDAYLARIAAYDDAGPELRAMLRLNPRARAEATALDAERRAGAVRGPLHGIPIILKDNFDTKDLPTTAGLLAFATLQPREDAFVVGRLRDAGAIILGKSNMHELAHGITTISSLGGQTRNPYDPRRNPGGSSGGTGVAIAASFAAVGWGSDTCGSIRIPCAFNGLVGLRPTQGLVSRRGIIPLSHTQDIGGPLARTAMDLAIALDATVAIDSLDPASRAVSGHPLPRFAQALSPSALRGARIAVLTHYMVGDTDEEIRDSVRAAVAAMKAQGADVMDLRIPGFDSLLAASSVIPFEMKFDIDDYLAARPGAPVSGFSKMLAAGWYHEALEPRYRLRDTMKVRDSEPYTQALAKQQLLRERLVALMDSLRLDAIVYPTVRVRPALIGDPQPGSTCQLAAHSGLPALSMPAGITADGLPIGVELMGRPLSDARLVSLAFSFEQSRPRRRPPPTTPALVDGRAPATRTVTATVSAAAATASVALSYDQARSTLAYTVRVSGSAARHVQAVVLRRTDAAGSRVIHRLSGPGDTSASGIVPLSPAEVHALMSGRVQLSIASGERMLSFADSAITLPR